MADSDNAVVLVRQIETSLNKIKQYILAQDLVVAQAVTADIQNVADNLSVFGGATANTAGEIGLVPAPSAGDNEKFLRGDGSWAAVANTSVGIISTVASDVDGGIWYSADDATPTLNIHVGNYNYSFNYSKVTYTGGNANLKSYLPFDSSPTADACGNVWETEGDVELNTDIKKFGAASLHTPARSYIYCENLFNLNADKWTVDFWVYRVSPGAPSIFILGGNSACYCGISVTRDKVQWQHITDEIAAEAGGTNLAPANKWTHFALVKNRTTFYVFKNGILQDTVDNPEYTSSYTTFVLGADGTYSGAGNDDLYIDNFRVREGIAVWKENFTVPDENDYK